VIDQCSVPLIFIFKVLIFWNEYLWTVVKFSKIAFLQFCYTDMQHYWFSFISEVIIMYLLRSISFARLINWLLIFPVWWLLDGCFPCVWVFVQMIVVPDTFRFRSSSLFRQEFWNLFRLNSVRSFSSFEFRSLEPVT